jgi:hypothetical protein
VCFARLAYPAHRRAAIGERFCERRLLWTHTLLPSKKAIGWVCLERPYSDMVNDTRLSHDEERRRWLLLLDPAVGGLERQMRQL